MKLPNIDKKKKKKKKKSTYRDANLAPIRIIGYLVLFQIPLNLILPIYDNNELGIFSFFQWCIVIALACSYLFNNGVWKLRWSVVEFFAIRSLQVIYHLFISSVGIHWVIFGVLVLIEIIFHIITGMHVSRYEFKLVDD